MMRAVILACLIGVALADLGNTSPPTGSCLCMSGYNVNVRNPAGLSGTVIGSASVGQCFMYLGQKVNSNGYIWFKVKFNGKDGWIAGKFMNLGYANQCTLCSSGENRLSHSNAKIELDRASIPIVSSGGCSNRNIGTCTSLDTIRCKCITDLVWFKQTSGCTVTVTGGTETGHASGTQSHWNGYKIDIRLTTCVDNYIQTRFTYIGTRSDGAKMYRDSRSNVYAKESNHWDIRYP